MMPGGPMTRTETKGERKRTTTVMAQTWWKKLLHKLPFGPLKLIVIFPPNFMRTRCNYVFTT